MIALASPYCSAAVVVLSNRTQGEVHFVLVDDVREQEYALAPEETRTMRIAPTTDFWFADDPDNGYRLRGGCAYVFLRSDRGRRLDLQRLGLADKQTWLDAEANTAPDPPVAPPAPGDEPTRNNQASAPVQVTVAVDLARPADADVWERSLRATFQKASKVISPQCGVRFEVVDFQLWQSDPSAADFDEVWRGLASAVPVGRGNLVVGFATRSLADSSCSGFPGTAGPLTSHLLIFAGQNPLSDDHRLEPLLHALGHYLGAAHSPETDSVMRPEFAQPSTDPRAIIRLDPINALAMALVGEDLATVAPQSLAELSPRVRQRLVSVYATLARALPNDPLADRFSRLISIEPAQAASRTRARSAEPTGAKAPSTPAEMAPREGESLTTTGSPSPRDPAPTADPVSLTAPTEQSDLNAERADAETEAELGPPAIPQALGLALVLVAIPATMLAWRLTPRHGTRRQPDGQETGPPAWQPMEAVDRAAWSLYLASVAGVAMMSATSLLSDEIGGFKAATVLLLAGLAALTVAPLYPMAGPLAYLVLSYAVQGDDPAATRIENSGVLAYLPALSVAALGLRFFRQRHRPRPPRDITTWVLMVMMAWIGLTAAGAAVGGLPVSAIMVHRLGRFAQVLVLFLVTLYADAGLAELRLTSLVLALTLLARVHVFRADVSLEQNLAMLAAIACPLLFVVAQTAPSRLAKVGFYVMSGYFVSLIGYSQNRAAMVTLPVTAGILLLSSPQRKRALLIAAPLAAVLAVWLLSSGRLNRFTEIYQEGEFQGSAYWRLRIWTAGRKMIRDHAALGVGPGNFEVLVGGYDSRLSWIPSHNSFVQMATETGLPGVAGYVILILAAGLQLALAVGRHGGDWRGLVAGGVLGGLAAHVVTGCFLENPSLAVTYVVLAMGLALAATPVTHVYRERLYLPLPGHVATQLAEFVVRLPRIVSGMPVAPGSSRIRESSGHDFQSGSDAPRWRGRSPGDRLPGTECRGYFAGLLVLDVLVTVAGSLAPFSFRPLGLGAALDSYGRQMSQPVEFGDRSDWLANMLLFAPLGFLAMAVCCPRRQGAWRVAASVSVVVGCVFVSSLIELAQVWFPSRTVNPNDVVAESVGAAAGAAAFLLFGDRFLALAAAVFARRNPLRTREKLLLCYAAGVIVYAAWPFDVTINPADFASKLREGRIGFTDWAEPGCFTNFAVSVAPMAPIGFLLRTLGLRQGTSVRSWPALVAWGGAWLLGIEFCRLLVFSQSVGLVHLGGGAVGILLGGLAQRLFTGSSHR